MTDGEEQASLVPEPAAITKGENMTFAEMQRQARAESEALAADETPCIYIGTDSCGRALGALETLDRIKAELDERGLKARLIEVGCLSGGYLEPLVAIARRGRPRLWYGPVTPELVPRVIEDGITSDNPRPGLALGTSGDGEINGIPRLAALPWFRFQVSITRRNCGHVDPASINDYIAHGGYGGLDTALKITPDEVIEAIDRAGLRGRGGAGFPTGDKWRRGRDAPGDRKYFIVNAASGDPGASTDRALLEGDPHSILEGLLIGAYAVSASQGYVYIPAEYSLAVARLQTALKQMADAGLLGENILGSPFSCQLEVREGVAAFVGGEQTALIRILEGQRPTPRPRPPFPTESGLGGQPTVVNNVETLAAVSAVLQRGVDGHAGHDTKSFTLGGRVARPGLIEVPLGTTLRQIIYDIGGGIPDNMGFKAALVGGPSGGLLPESTLDVPVDYESLAEAGAIVGSGSITVAASDACIVDLAKNCLAFTQAESCGQCVFCREGLMQMLEIFKDITGGKARPEAIELLLELGEGIRLGSLCGLGGTAPNPVLTAIRYFREEFEAHCKGQPCPAGACQPPA